MLSVSTIQLVNGASKRPAQSAHTLDCYLSVADRPDSRPPAVGLQRLELQAAFNLCTVICPWHKLAASPGGICRWADGLDLARLDKGCEHGLTVTLELAREL
jgi:hypothetical protein